MTIENISATGLRFISNRTLFCPGDVVSVRIDINDGPLARSAVFESQVVWADETSQYCGAIFVGPGRWEAG